LLADDKNERKVVKTFIRGFDPLVNGGIPKPSFIVLAGHPGTGKSTFGIQFLLNGANVLGEPGIYSSFLEREEIFIQNMNRSYGFDFKSAKESNKLTFLEFSPLAAGAVSDMFNEIIKTVIESGSKRLVIDSLNALFSDLPAAEQRRMLEIVINRVIKEAGCTVIGILEQSIGIPAIGFGIEEFVADGLITFESYVESFEIKRRAVIRKLRGTQHSTKYQSILLTPGEGMSFIQMID
jgi:circadian clock protein KaiC